MSEKLPYKHGVSVLLLLNQNCCSYFEADKFDVILTVHRRQYVEIKCQLDATEVFIADFIACSTCFGHHYAHHQELKSIIIFLFIYCIHPFSHKCDIGHYIYKLHYILNI